MEDILQKCLKADNEAILQGTKELKEALKKPEAIPALCNVVVSAKEVEIRQYAALVLQKRLAKFKHWSKLSEADRAVIKTGILQALVNEPHKPVKNSIAQFIGVILKHEGSANTWPGLQQVLFEFPLSSDVAQKELGLYLLNYLVEMNPKLFVPCADQLCQLVSGLIKTDHLYQLAAGVLKPDAVVDLHSPLFFYAINILKCISEGTQNIQSVVNTTYETLPIVLQVLLVVAKGDTDQAIKLIQVIDDFSDSLPVVFDAHIKLVVESMLTIAKLTELEDDVRSKSLAFLGLLFTKKKKILAKQNLIKPVVDTLFLVICTPSDDEHFNGDDGSPVTTAHTALDSMALNLPPGKVVGPLIDHIERGMVSSVPYDKRAALTAMAVIAEGCAEFIRTKHMRQFVQYVLNEIVDENPVVRNAALFALGQFSEHLQPDIAEFADDVMPVLLNYLEHLCLSLKEQQLTADDPQMPHIERIFYALETFCDNMDEKLKPYLPAVVERLLVIFDSSSPVIIRGLAISALNAAANSAEEQMAPFLPRILESLHVFLTKEQPEEMLILQIHAIVSLGVFARKIGTENFRPLANESLQIALTLMNKIDEPDLRKATYSLLAALSGILETEMHAVLEHIVQAMLGCLKSEDGMKGQDTSDSEDNLAVYEDFSDENDEEDIGDESDRSDDDDLEFHMDDAFTEEKEEACSALGELAKNTGIAFLPYYDVCFEQLGKLVNHPGGHVRCAALDAVAELCGALSNAGPSKEEDQEKVIAFLVPKCAEIIQTDHDRDAVAAALDALDILLTKIGERVLKREGHYEAIVNSIVQVLTSKTVCQEDDDETPPDEDGMAEQDELLFEYAGNVIPQLGKAMKNPEKFAETFKMLLPLLLAKTSEHSSTAQKSFVSGTLAECMEPLSLCGGAFVDQVLPLLMTLGAAEESEVRNNSIFAIGEYMLHARDAIYPHYPAILRLLSDAVSRETVPGNLDNICGAIARMIIVNSSLIPLDSVVPVLIQHLPLREDFEENLSVFRCLNYLYQLSHPSMKEQMPALVRIAMTVIYKKAHTKPETVENVMSLLACIQRDFPEIFQAATSELTPEQLQFLQERLSMPA